MKPLHALFTLAVSFVPAAAHADAVLPETPAWSAAGFEEYAFFGEAIAFAGDVDGDGYGDLLLGAPNQDTSPQIQNDGAIYLYRGGPSGPDAEPSWSAAGGEWNAEFGAAVASAGDVNGDGKADILAGGHWANKAALWLGSATGPADAPDWSWVDTTDGFSEFGISVAGVGDVNGDGFDDIAVGACYCTALEGNGRVYVFFGATNGIRGSPPLVLEGPGANTQFGISVAAAGDLNGDGFADLLVGADYAPFVNDANGEAYLFLGGPEGPAAEPAWTVRGENAQDRFGYTLAAAGDWNGDGKPDIAIGAHNYGAGSDGRLFAFAGGNDVATDPAWTADGVLDGASLGYALAYAGDLNGDGHPDLVAGGDTYSNGEYGEGAAWVYLGGPDATGSPVWTREGGSADAGYGAAVAAGGDVNGDGGMDVIVGAPYWTDEAGVKNRGRVELFLGTPYEQPGEPGEPKPGEAGTGAATGCACSLSTPSAGSSAPAWLGFALVALPAAVRVRRRNS